MCNPFVAEGEYGAVLRYFIGRHIRYILKDTPDEGAVGSCIRVNDGYTAVGDDDGVSFVC